MDPVAAFAHHPFGPFLLVAMGVALVLKPRGERLDAWLNRLWRMHRGLRWGAAGIAIAWGAWAVARAVATGWQS